MYSSAIFLLLCFVSFPLSDSFQQVPFFHHGSLVLAVSSPKTRSFRQSNLIPLASSSTSSSASSSNSSPVQLQVNPLLASVKPSKTVEVFSLVKQLEAEGQHVTSLCVGEPDFPPPQAVLDATVAAVKSGKTKYTAVTGTAELRQAIADDLKRRKGIEYNPITDIVVGNGAKQCVFQSVLATCGVGDGVLIVAPYWPSYPEMATLVGAEPVFVETRAQDGFLLTPQALRAALEANPKIKCLIFCNPSNPTGGVHNEERLQELAQVLQDYPQVAILADEIYERLVYNGQECPSFASMPHMFHRTLTLNGFSKAYSMTGYRLGYVAGPTHLIKAISTIQSQLTSCASSLSQAAGVAALTQVSDDELDQNVQLLQAKRDYVLGQLEGIPNVTVQVPPQGAFYVLPDMSHYFNGDDADLCLQLLQKKQLALVPGSSFGAPGTVRISYATSMEELQEAMRKLGDFLKEES